MLKSKLIQKILVIGVLALGLYIPLTLVDGIISERQGFRDIARKDIASSWTGEQLLSGPVLAIPYLQRVEKTVVDKVTAKRHLEQQAVWKTFYIPPVKLETSAEITTQLRFRGIHGVPVYTARIAAAGHFSTERLVALATTKDSIIRWGKPYLSVGVSDNRGIGGRPNLNWNGLSYGFQPGQKSSFFSNGLHTELPEWDVTKQRDFSFDYALDLRGMEILSLTPTGLDTQTSISSDWPHPSFHGHFLPESRDMDTDGFEAHWHISSFSSNIEKVIQSANQGSKPIKSLQTFGVSLVNPVDVYLQSERSVKYGLMFIGLTFVAFFLYEVLKRIPIHPVQYTLVGLSLSFFYLLLVAFSEHLGFSAAYLIGTLSCSGLLAFYITAVLRNSRVGLGLGLVITLLYGMLYVIIQSEDHALLMGSLLLFGMLTLVMYTTRHLDWYHVGDQLATVTEQGNNLQKQG